jgi:hypothetical protein
MILNMPVPPSPSRDFAPAGKMNEADFICYNKNVAIFRRRDYRIFERLGG